MINLLSMVRCRVIGRNFDSGKRYWGENKTKIVSFNINLRFMTLRRPHNGGPAGTIG